MNTHTHTLLVLVVDWPEHHGVFLSACASDKCANVTSIYSFWCMWHIGCQWSFSTADNLIILIFCILQEFRRISLCGYVLNAKQDNFYFMSLSRHHPQRIQACRRLSKPATALQTADPCSSGGRVEEAMLEKEVEFQPLEADSEVRLKYVLVTIRVQRHKHLSKSIVCLLILACLFF